MTEPIRLSPQELTGRSRRHIADLQIPRCSVHQAVVEPLRAMRAAAAEEGLDVVALSSFRDFTRQLAIWNGKCRGERELRDRSGAVLDFATLDADGLITAILYWSALPGASRHHWGTELDLVDAKAQPVEAAKLVTEEYAGGGVYGRLNRWLDANAARFGFFRPYSTDRGGHQPEPWHFSYAPVAECARQDLTLEVLTQALGDAAMECKAQVLRRLPELYQKYLVNVDPPPREISGAIIRGSTPS